MPSHNPKDNSNKKGTADERRRQRQVEAEERKRVAASRTPEEQLAILRSRGITSGREYEKLTRLIESGKGKLPNGQASHDKVVPEDTSTYPKRKLKAKERRAQHVKK